MQIGLTLSDGPFPVRDTKPCPHCGRPMQIEAQLQKDPLIGFRVLSATCANPEEHRACLETVHLNGISIEGRLR